MGGVAALREMWVSLVYPGGHFVQNPRLCFDLHLQYCDGCEGTLDLDVSAAAIISVISFLHTCCVLSVNLD